MTDLPLTLDSFIDTTSESRQKWTWKLKKEAKTEKDFTPYLAKNLVVCLEMELNYKMGVTDSTFDEVCQTELGVPASESMPDCPVCGDDDCEEHDPPKTIRVVKSDCTIRGKEIIVWGSPIPSEEFAKRLPLENIKKYFAPRPQDSLHTHALIPHNLQTHDIPIQIAQNSWEFFRAYYPAWVHIFGNYKKHLLRSSWAQWKSYSTSLLNVDNWAYASHKFQGGLHFSNCSLNFDSSMITHFDAEIRTQDASTDLEQIVSARALSKAIFLKSAQLASEGIIEMSDSRKSIVLPVISAINNGCERAWREGNPYGKKTYDMTLESKHGAFMKDLAVEFFNQVREFLSPFEAKCVENCIANPVRFRRKLA
jgi:hypothetical protein